MIYAYDASIRLSLQTTVSSRLVPPGLRGELASRQDQHVMLADRERTSYDRRLRRRREGDVRQMFEGLPISRGRRSRGALAMVASVSSRIRWAENFLIRAGALDFPMEAVQLFRITPPGGFRGLGALVFRLGALAFRFRMAAFLVGAAVGGFGGLAFLNGAAVGGFGALVFLNGAAVGRIARFQGRR